MSNPVCPFAVQRILHGDEDRRPTIVPVGTAAHTAVTRAHGMQLGDYFDQESVKPDSTFYNDEHGELYQFNPVNREAAAQFEGNAFPTMRDGKPVLAGIVSIEHWDGGNPSIPLNDAQIATDIRLYAWLHTEWGISLDVSTAWDGDGAGWHSKYPEWNHNHHLCPGDVRIHQLLDVILPGARRLVATNQEDLVQHPFVATIPAPDAKGSQIVGTPFKFADVAAVAIKANDDGRPVKAIVQPFAYGDGLALSFIRLDGKPLTIGAKIGVIVTTV